MAGSPGFVLPIRSTPVRRLYNSEPDPHIALWKLRGRARPFGRALDGTVTGRCIGHVDNRLRMLYVRIICISTASATVHRVRLEITVAIGHRFTSAQLL